MDKVEGGIYEAVITMSRAGGHNAALAIMTTDLKCKEIAVEIEIQGKPVRIGGMAKGSGMIHPDMATMLVFITTDAAIDSKCLQKLVKASADLSFNMISVDRDTSTNDMLAVLSNGLAGNPAIEDENSEDAKFAAA
jgi:glutamate N-acetyltransferase/amino-acid N-acetyltransferase